MDRAVGTSIEPDILDEVVWIAERMWPKSFVCVTRTSGLFLFYSWGRFFG